MKKITLLCCCLLVTAITFAQNEFVTTWQTTTPNESITIPTTGTGYSYTVDWGDGNTSTAQTGNATHSYATAGTYTVKIADAFPRIYFNNTGDKLKIKTIEQWGTNAWTSMAGAFFGCSNLTSNATDIPNLSSVTNMSDMFNGATAFNGNISNWNVSSVTNMYAMFYQAAAFNQNISSWNVSSVTNMNSMFDKATAFNQNISSWNVSSVTNMYGMFYKASAFNQNISTWDVSSVTNMGYVFALASAFNGNISSWNVSSVTNMYGMFYQATAFSQDLSSWNVSSVTDMRYMFSGASAFNQNLSTWDVSSVADMTAMFYQAIAFNQNISSWNVSSVTSMYVMFYQATAFNQNLGAWDISSVTDMGNMFTSDTLSTANYDNTLIGWSTLSTGETKIPTGITFDGGNSKYTNIGKAGRDLLTGTYSWTITDGGLNNAALFITIWQTTTPNESITIPTTGTGYNYAVDWGDGNTSTAQTGNTTHSYAAVGTYTVKITGTFPRIYFNNTGDKLKIKTIEQWGTNAWASMDGAFYGCANLTSNATDTPNLSSVTDMRYMFNKAAAFNGNISNWNVSSVTSMYKMFDGATAFNQNLNTWNVSSVTNMRYMFSGATAFNQDLSSWNVSNVTDMYAMFYKATAFNQDLSSWNVSSVTSMYVMFNGASAFNQDLGAWDISSVTNMSGMFTSVTLSTANYDNTLIGWSTLSTGETKIPTGITFDGGNSTYCAGETAKNTLTGSPYNWTITDGGISSSCTLAVNDYNMATSLELYPNPSTNMIYLSGNISKLQKVSVYSILGRRVMTINKNFKAINIEALNTGIYFVKLITNKGIKTIELVKE